MSRAEERLRFEGATGEQLAARLARPEGKPRAYVLFAHCFSCSKDLKAVARISRALVAEGLAVLRFDFTGLGESEGDFADTNFSSNVEDLVAAADFLRRDHEAPRLLIGHSLGGAAVLAAASRIPEATAVATLGAPSDTDHLRRQLLDRAPELADSNEAEVRLGGRPFRIRRQLLDDLKGHTLNASIRELDRALLVMHSPADEVVDIGHARRIFDAARHPKSFIALDGADHLLLRRAEDARFAGQVLAAWAGRYLGEEEGDAGATAAASSDDVAVEPGAAGGRRNRPAPGAQPGEVIVVGGGELTQQVAAGAHGLTADEPASAGGRDQGPTPYDLLLAALGTCTAMTLRLYADRKKWDLRKIEVRLRHERIHAKDCADCETREGRIDRIHRVIGLDGELDADQIARLLEIADRCPVHRTLTGEIRIETKLRLPPAS